MSEIGIIQGIQDVLQASAAFGDADVTIEDWSVLDQVGALDAAPFAVIRVSDNFEAVQNTASEETTWQIPVLVYEAWDKDWPTTRKAFGATRQTIIDAFNAQGAARSAGGITGVDIQAIRAATPLEQDADARGDYTYMVQVLIFETLERAT